MKTGTVQFFDKTKKFGFLVKEDGGRVFFHLNDGGRTETTAGEYPTLTFALGEGSEEPKPGDTLLFVEEKESRGLKARPWWITPVGLLRKDVRCRFIKFLHVPGAHFDRERHGEVVWEGNDFIELATWFPREGFREENFSCGDFDEWSEFERQTPEGWERCHDPRPFFTMYNYRARSKNKRAPYKPPKDFDSFDF